MLTIKILGPGCANCQKLAQIAAEAAEQLGIPFEIVKVTKMDEIMRYDILRTPGLVINEQLVCSGRIPTTNTVAAWLQEARSD
ncbi:thioredoxin family protein [Chitinilyticum piscinae]|uniref:TM0996/MTH895 family glutaredoxin-like protein n=1 Tax=Chitinilyticum piscinae TaxID=2866724 RepID=A0A8J7FLP5_9NEIS|nr:thioredoxin family protein [Chitinilyticum piscinae]MBE9610382.1 TM0996/MTH895 family glutaredoxin-like protein [Chitinilyticum piscinae]